MYKMKKDKSHKKHMRGSAHARDGRTGGILLKNKNKNIINIKINTSRKSKRKGSENRRFADTRTEIIHHYSSPQLTNYQPFQGSAPGRDGRTGILLNNPIIPPPPVIEPSSPISPIATMTSPKHTVGLVTRPIPATPKLTSNTSNHLASSSSNSLFTNNRPLTTPLRDGRTGVLLPAINETDDESEFEKAMSRTQQRRTRRRKLPDNLEIEDDNEEYDGLGNRIYQPVAEARNPIPVMNATYDPLNSSIDDDYETIKSIFTKYDPKQLSKLKPLSHYVNGDGRQLRGLNSLLEKAKMLTQTTPKKK